MTTISMKLRLTVFEHSDLARVLVVCDRVEFVNRGTRSDDVCQQEHNFVDLVGCNCDGERGTLRRVIWLVSVR